MTLFYIRATRDDSEDMTFFVNAGTVEKALALHDEYILSEFDTEHGGLINRDVFQVPTFARAREYVLPWFDSDGGMVCIHGPNKMNEEEE